MINQDFLEQQFSQNCKKKLRVVPKDIFKSQFNISVEVSKDQAAQEFEIPQLTIKKSDKNQRVIELERRPNDKIDLEIFDGKINQETKVDYCMRLLKYFCQHNIQKYKEISKAVSDLQNGMIFLKYSRGSRCPHEKIFFYKHDKQKHLLISRLPSDTSGRKEKVTNIKDIVQITQVWKNGPGFNKFQKDDPRIIDELCIVIQLNNKKTIEMLANTQQQRDLFYSYLELIREQIREQNKANR